MNQNEKYGFILIDTEEKKRKYHPVTEGDEIRPKGAIPWTPIDGTKLFDPNFCYCCEHRRRLVLPSDDYVLVGLEEVIQGEDEYTLDGVKWFAVKLYGLSIGSTVATQFERGSHTLAIRRKKSPAQPVAGWVPISTLPKESDYPVWVTDCISVDEAKIMNVNGRPHSIKHTSEWDLNTVTHWCSKPNPQPPPLPNPEPVKSDEEKAFKSYWTGLEGTSAELEESAHESTWLAALDWQKKGAK